MPPAFGKAYSQRRFHGRVNGENRAKFGTRGKRICVTGKISDYHGKAEIVLTDPSELSR
jgi:DNA/RNA endonuclease YhcR with UshA esterase domain